MSETIRIGGVLYCCKCEEVKRHCACRTIAEMKRQGITLELNPYPPRPRKWIDPQVRHGKSMERWNKLQTEAMLRLPERVELVNSIGFEVELYELRG